MWSSCFMLFQKTCLLYVLNFEWRTDICLHGVTCRHKWKTHCDRGSTKLLFKMRTIMLLLIIIRMAMMRNKWVVTFDFLTNGKLCPDRRKRLDLQNYDEFNGTEVPVEDFKWETQPSSSLLGRSGILGIWTSLFIESQIIHFKDPKRLYLAKSKSTDLPENFSCSLLLFVAETHDYFCQMLGEKPPLFHCLVILRRCTWIYEKTTKSHRPSGF